MLHTSRPRVELVSESMRQTELYVELPARPPDGERVDLSSARVRYEWGGQVLDYVSETATGSLTLDTRDGRPFADIDATFKAPLVGSGERTLDVTLPLEATAP